MVHREHGVGLQDNRRRLGLKFTGPYFFEPEIELEFRGFAVYAATQNGRMRGGSLQYGRGVRVLMNCANHRVTPPAIADTSLHHRAVSGP